MWTGSLIAIAAYFLHVFIPIFLLLVHKFPSSACHDIDSRKQFVNAASYLVESFCLTKVDGEDDCCLSLLESIESRHHLPLLATEDCFPNPLPTRALCVVPQKLDPKSFVTFLLRRESILRGYEPMACNAIRFVSVKNRAVKSVKNMRREVQTPACEKLLLESRLSISESLTR
jgi:hypothetical protein